MARRFRRVRDGVDCRLDDLEAALVAELVADLLQLLDAEPVRGDEVLERLFPDGYRDDPEAATELRSLIESDLREGKQRALRVMAESLARRDGRGRLHLDTAAAEAWLGALNDLRLSLGTRLGVTEDPYDELADLPSDDARRHALEIYGWLGWLQEGLVESLLD